MLTPQVVSGESEHVAIAMLVKHTKSRATANIKPGLTRYDFSDALTSFAEWMLLDEVENQPWYTETRSVLSQKRQATLSPSGRELVSKLWTAVRMAGFQRLPLASILPLPEGQMLLANPALLRGLYGLFMKHLKAVIINERKVAGTVAEIGTIIHELTHGLAFRFDQMFSEKATGQQYARHDGYSGNAQDEIVAELSAAMVCLALKVDGYELQTSFSVSYLRQQLRDMGFPYVDPQAIVDAFVVAWELANRILCTLASLGVTVPLPTL